MSSLSVGGAIISERRLVLSCFHCILSWVCVSLRRTSGNYGFFIVIVCYCCEFLHQLAMPKDRTEVSCCVKYLLFFFNVFFWVSLYDKCSTHHGDLLTCKNDLLMKVNTARPHITPTRCVLFPVYLMCCYTFPWQNWF